MALPVLGASEIKYLQKKDRSPILPGRHSPFALSIHFLYLLSLSNYATSNTQKGGQDESYSIILDLF